MKRSLIALSLLLMISTCAFGQKSGPPLRKDSGLIAVRNFRPVVAYAVSTGSGNVDPAYTVSVGKKAIYFSVTFYNTSGSSSTCAEQIKKTDGTYRLIFAGAGAGAGAGITISSPILLNAGEKPSASVTAAGVNINFKVWEFDDPGNLFRVDKDPITTGDNIFYTVPAGKVAQLAAISAFPNIVGSSASVLVSNQASVTRTYIGHILPAGVTSTSLATRQTVSQAVAAGQNGNVFGAIGRPVMDEGEKIVINSDGGEAGQWAYAMIILFDKP